MYAFIAGTLKTDFQITFSKKMCLFNSYFNPNVKIDIDV